jgi:parallel beta-helix repeat protein
MCCGLFAYSPAAHAAQSYDNCNNFIDTLPATISTQGVWCLHKDLSTNITSGKAITIAANNVTIDCNDFKLGGLAAGPGSTAIGIYAIYRQNATVRRCNVRGFFYGTSLDGDGGAGHLVEDNRLDNNLFAGIYVAGDNNLIRRNRVFDTGSERQIVYGILASADIIDNTIAGVFGYQSSDSRPRGIVVFGNGAVVRDNRIRGLAAVAPGTARGISIGTKGIIVDGNTIIADAATSGKGIGLYELATSDADATCSNNIVRGFTENYSGCVAEVDNIDLP